MTKELGRSYVALLEKQYTDVPRRADHCVYWIRKAHDHLAVCTKDDPLAGRAGLVGTQNIRNNYSRIGGLDHVVTTGTITEAVENQPWSGEADVNVSIANWVKSKDSALLPKTRKLWFKVQESPAEPKRRRSKGQGSASKEYQLSFRDCEHINSALSDETDVAAAGRLKCNYQPKRCFEGIQPGHKAFRITAQTRASLAVKDDLDSVVVPYVGGTRLLSGAYRKKPEWLIDFGKKNLLQVSAWPETLRHVQAHVLKKWQENAAEEGQETGRASGEHQNRVKTWWRLKRRRSDLQEAIALLPRYMVCVRVTKRPVISFLHASIRPDSSLSCFAFADDYSFGVLQSSLHRLWYVTKCSKLTERFRYTPESIFDTFPWPQAPMVDQIDALVAAAREVRRVRAEALQELKGGLRALYRTLELPGANPLKDAHAALDTAVIVACGFTTKKDLLAQLLALNLEVAAKIEKGEPVMAPGIPKTYPEPKNLVTEDCIRPATL